MVDYPHIDANRRVIGRHRKEGFNLMGPRPGAQTNDLGQGRHVDDKRHLDGPPLTPPRPRISAHGVALEEGVL